MVRVFRQQAALDNTLQWNTLHPGIQASTLMGKVSGSTFLLPVQGNRPHSSPVCFGIFPEPCKPATFYHDRTISAVTATSQEVPQVVSRHLCVLEQGKMQFPECVQI